MKKTPLRRKSKSNTAKLQDKLWQLCRKIVYYRDKDTEGYIDCFSCGKRRIEAHNRQLGHLIPNAAGGAALRYDLRNLHYQCYSCNINLGGNGAEYYRRMVELHGKPYVEKIFKDKHTIVKATDHYEKLMIEYTQMLNDYEKTA